MEFKPGRFDDISLEDYHRMEGWSKSALDKVNISMAHYFAKGKTTPTLEFGSAFHSSVLTPELYNSEYAVSPDFGDHRTKAGKELRANFVLENTGKKIIDWKDAAKIDAMSNAIFNHPVASQLLKDGDAEHSFFWIDEVSGLKCKARPDYLRHDKIVVELKTTSSAEWFDFQRSIVKYRYHAQGAHFTNGITQATGVPHNTFIIIAVESDEPYNVSVFNLHEDALKAGSIAIRRNLDRVVDYEKSEDKWAGYPCMIQEMYLPKWAE